MKTRKLGSLDASVIGLGCNNFGGRLDYEGTKAVLDACLDHGVTFLDTADTYGLTESERLMGRALKGRRDQVVLASKFGMPNEKAGLKGGADPRYIHSSIDGSLKRLQTDRIDLYQLHRPDPDVPITDTLGALQELIEAGKVLEIGCSNFSAAQLREAEDAASEHGLPRFVSVQNEFSLLRREAEQEVLPACRELGIGFLPYFPLLSGILTGKYRRGQPLPEGTRVTGSERWEAKLTPAVLEAVEQLGDWAESHGRQLLDLAFAWLLKEPAVPSVIAGAMNRGQVEANARAATWELTEEEKAEVDGILTDCGFTPEYPPSLED